MVSAKYPDGVTRPVLCLYAGCGLAPVCPDILSGGACAPSHRMYLGRCLSPCTTGGLSGHWSGIP